MKFPFNVSASVYAALGAALLFGASTPFAKQLLRDVSPVLLAGLLYLGSGVGLGIIRLVRDRGWHLPAMSRSEWAWLLLAIGFGGVLGPLLLMLGLATTLASTASLLLNLEAVLTALIAWVVFRENTDRNVVLGMIVIVVGAVLLAWPDSSAGAGKLGWGALLIAAACLCWALDNNFTRKVSATDALFLAGLKGGGGGRGREHRYRSSLGCCASRCRVGGRGHDGGAARLRSKPSLVRVGLTRAGDSPYWRLFFNGSFHRSCYGRFVFRRAGHGDFLGSVHPHGGRCLAPSCGAP